MNKQVCVSNAMDEVFHKLRENGEKALITYIAAGDPDLETTEQLVPAMAAAGADLIEIGVPFSDPVAEGPIISQASERALKNPAVHLGTIFSMTARIQRQCKTPLLLMLYANSVYRYGVDAFFRDCAGSGISGVIVPDVPFEERGEFLPAAQARQVHLINLVAPTSRERVETIAAASEGFLYCVSSMGVTGVRSSFSTDFDAMSTQIRGVSQVPACLGFGISTPEHVAQLSPYCDGLIVGSAIVKIVGEQGRGCIPAVKDFVTSLKKPCYPKD